MSAGRDVRAVGPEHARQAEVGQLAHKAARVLRRRLAALDEHVGALQVTAGQGKSVVKSNVQLSPRPFVLAPTRCPAQSSSSGIASLCGMLAHAYHFHKMHVRLHTHAAFMQLCNVRCGVCRRGGHLCTMPRECRYFMPEAMSIRLSSVLPCRTRTRHHHQSLHTLQTDEQQWTNTLQP